jgi:hypothetical protein
VSLVPASEHLFADISELMDRAPVGREILIIRCSLAQFLAEPESGAMMSENGAGHPCVLTAYRSATAQNHARAMSLMAWQPDTSVEPGRRFWMTTSLVASVAAMLLAGLALGLAAVIARPAAKSSEIAFLVAWSRAAPATPRRSSSTSPLNEPVIDPLQAPLARFHRGAALTPAELVPPPTGTGERKVMVIPSAYERERRRVVTPATPSNSTER